MSETGRREGEKAVYEGRREREKEDSGKQRQALTRQQRPGEWRAAVGSGDRW